MATQDPSLLLRRSLQGNAWFSGLSGLLLLIGAGPIGMLLGTAPPWMIRTLGLGLLLYTLWLLMAAQRASLDHREVGAAIGLDAAWVLGSILLLIADPLPLTFAGKWTVGITADIVATFALLQTYGLLKYEAAAVLVHPATTSRRRDECIVHHLKEGL